MNAVENLKIPERVWTSTLPPPKPLRPELSALKSKLEQLGPKTATSQGSAPQMQPDSGQNLDCVAVPSASVAVSAQPSVEAVSAGMAGVKPANPVAPKKKPYIKEFSLTAPEQASSLPDGQDMPEPAKGQPECFPHSSFPEAIRKIAEQLASVYQAPICVTEMCLLASLSAAVGKSVVVKRAYRDLVTMLNLFVVVVAERGTCKSVVGQKATAPIQLFSDDLGDEHRKKVANRKSELAVLKKEAAKLESEIGKVGPNGRAELLARLSEKHQKLAELEEQADRDVTAIVSDITGEALVRALQENGETLFSYSSEAGTVVSVTAGKYRDGKADLDPYLCGYSGDPLRANRVDRGAVVVKQPCLTLLWLMQSIVAMDLVGNRDTIPRGFSARTLFFDSGARREHDNRRDESFTLSQDWVALVNRLLLRRKVGAPAKEIDCTAEAREVFAKFHDEGIDWERRWCPDLIGEFSRQRENAVKIAGLFALVEGLDEISAEIASRATGVVRWVGYNYLTLIQSERQKRLKRDLDRIMELLVENGGQIRLGALAQYHGIKREKVEALLAVYPGSLELKKTPQPDGKAGRPGEALCLVTSSGDSDGNKIEKIEKIRGGGTAA